MPTTPAAGPPARGSKTTSLNGSSTYGLNILINLRGIYNAPRMHDYCCAVLILLILVVMAYVVAQELQHTIVYSSKVVSGVDKYPYRVHSAYQNKTEASDTMAGINKRVVELMRHLKKKYVLDGGNAAEFPGRAAAAELMLAKYNPDSIRENSPLDPFGDTSYTINKGETLALCLRSKKGQDIHKMNTLMFVVYHELAHIGTNPEKDAHSPKFWSTFRFILEEAAEIGAYTPVDYSARPAEYCGIKIWNSPLFDGGVADLA